MKTKPILTNYFKAITNSGLPHPPTEARFTSPPRVVTAIQRTIALQEEIDALYPEAESRIVENG